MSGQPTVPRQPAGTVTWRQRSAMIVLSLVWVLVLLSVIFRVGPGPGLFNNNLFWGAFVVILVGPKLVSSRGRASLTRGQNDWVVRGFRLFVELPVTVWFCVLYPGYWWLGAIAAGSVLLELASPRIERAAAEQQARQAAVKAAREPRPPEDS
jgi:hypothetical protein